MDQIVTRIEALIRSDNQKEITSELVSIQHDLAAKLVQDIEEEKMVSYFSKFWTAIFNLANSQFSSVRLTSYTTITIFLMKMCPFYPEIICRSFSNVINECDLDSSSAYVIVASFAYLTNYIAPILLQDFLNTTPIFHYFFQASSLSSDRLSSVISNLPWLGDYWFNTVFAAFLTQYIKNPSRTVLNSVSQLMTRAPTQLTKLLLQFGNENNWNQHYITILAFLVTSDDFDKSFDFSIPKKSAFDYLNQESSPAFKSDCFKILSVFNDGLEITQKSSDTLVFTLNKKSIKINYQLYENEPTFFLLPLPFDLLEPKETDSSAIFNSKLENIGKLTQKTNSTEIIQRTINIIDRISGNNPSRNSSVLNCISFCANNILIKSETTSFSNVLYRIIFSNSNMSWFEYSQILRYFKIDHRLFKRAFGYDGEKKVRKMALEFAKNKNKKFSNEAIPFVVNLSKYYFYEMTSEVLLDTDFFDNENLSLHLKILSEILLRNEQNKEKINFTKSDNVKSDSDHLSSQNTKSDNDQSTSQNENITKSDTDHFSIQNEKSDKNHFTENYYHDISHLQELPSILMELEIPDDLELISYWFIILSFFDLSSNNCPQMRHLIDSAVAVIHATTTILTGSQRRISISNAIAQPIYEKTNSFLMNRTIDITEKGSVDNKIVLQPVYSATRFILSLPFGIIDRNFLRSVVERMFRFFPQICSDFLLKHFEEFTSKERLHIIRKLHKQLDSVSSPHVHAQWAELALFDINDDEFNNHITSDSLYFIENPEKIHADDLFEFVTFLTKSDKEKYSESILKLFNGLTAAQIHVFCLLSQTKHQGLREIYENEFKRFTSLDLSYSSSDLLNSFMKSDKKDAKDIEFFRQNLSGLDLELFEEKIKQEKSKKVNLQTVCQKSCHFRNEVTFQTAIFDSIINNEKIDFEKLDLPPEFLSFVYDHLLKWKKSEIMKDILSKFTPYDAGTEREIGIITKAVSNFNAFISQLMTIEKVTKNQMRVLSRVLELVEDGSTALPILLSLLRKEYSKNRKHFLLSLVNVYLKQTHSNNTELRKLIFAFIQSNQDLSLEMVSTTLAELSKIHVLEFQEMKLMKDYMAVGGLTSLPCYNFSEILLPETISQKRYMPGKTPPLNELISKFMENLTPSSVSRGFRLMTTVLIVGSSEFGNNFLKKSLSSYIENVLVYKHNPFVIRTISDLLEKILLNEELNQIQSIVIECFLKITDGDYESPSMVHLIKIISPLVANSVTHNSELLKFITKVVKTFEISDSFEIFDIQLQIRGRMISKVTTNEKRHQIITDRFINWIRNREGFDSYYIVSFYVDWLNIFLNYTDRGNVSQIACSNILRSSQRFFVAIVILAKAMKETDEEEKRIFIETLHLMKPHLTADMEWDAIAACLDHKVRQAFDICCH